MSAEIESIDKVLSMAEDLLSKFLDPARAHERPVLVRSLKPLAEDYEKVFTGVAIEQARAGYVSLWEAPPDISPRPGQHVLKVSLAMSEELGTDATRAHAFPGGFEAVRQALTPGYIWIAWRFVAPGETGGMSYHGLVHMGAGRFVWFPKPWKVLGGGKLRTTPSN